MKGLDTPVLLGLLRGEPKVTALLRRWEREEVCTTAINLFELETIARGDAPRGRERRLAALDRLRRKLTILPVDERSARLGAQEAAKSGGKRVSGTSWLILGALESGGCSEWITVKEAQFPSSGGLRVTFLPVGKPKA